jgi:hypothetical protein
LSSWVDKTDEEDEEDDDAVLCIIARFYENAPTYAWGKSSCGQYLERIGVMVDEQAARAAVEFALERVRLSPPGPPP